MSDYGNNAQVSGDLNVTGSSTFNEDSADVNLRVESDAEVNMLFVDGGTNRVGIGTGAPSGTLHVSGPGTSDTKVIVESLGDSSIWLVADTDDAGGEAQNPSFYMSQETATDDAYQFHMGLEGLANQTYTGSFTNQPFILSQNSSGAQLRTFQIATDDGGDVSSRLSIGSGGRVIIGDAVGSADTRLHVRETTGDIFKLENTTAYGVTHGQLVATGVTLTGGSSQVDTGLNLPGSSIIDTVLIKITTLGAVSSGADYTVTNITVSGAAPLTAQTLFSASLSNLGLISSLNAQSGTMYYLNNTQTNFPMGAYGILANELYPTSLQDIKIDFSSANVSTNAVVDVAVHYRKFDTIR